MLQGRPVVGALGMPVVGALGRRPADRGMLAGPVADRSRPPSSLATNKACLGATIMASTYGELHPLVQAIRKHVLPLLMWVKRHSITNYVFYTYKKDCKLLSIKENSSKP